MNRSSPLSRRALLKRGAAAASALAFPTVIPSSVLGKDGAVAPSNQITLGVMGYGNRCKVVLEHFLSFKEIRCLGVSDVQDARLKACKAYVDKHHETTDCQAYPDFRDMFARKDIQSVLIATGPRWHGLGSIMAAKAGKDVYSEKPICLTLEEGRTLVETCKRNGTIYQAGHQRRSVDSYRFQVEAVRKGLIGKLHTIDCQVWTIPPVPRDQPQPVPPGFDYNMWLGPTPWHPYTPNRVARWQYFWDTAEGNIADMGCHYTDIGQWGHNSDDTGPVDFEGEAVFDPNAFSETPISGECRATYADGVKLIMRQQGGFADRYIRFIGTDGWVQVDDHTNAITASSDAILKTRGVSARSWALTGDHIGNFLDCIRTRQPTICNPEVAHRAMSICMIMNIGLRLGRKVKWDPAAERFINDDDANRMISRAMRAPWHL